MTITKRLRCEVESAPTGAFFHVADCSQLGPRSGLETAFSRLRKAGVLERASKGLYWKPARSRFGRGKPSTMDVVLNVARQKAPGLAGATAANALGLSTQMSPVPEIAVVGAKPKSVDGVVFRTRSNAARARLNPLEIAVYEVVRDRFAHVQVERDEMNARLLRLAREGRIDLAKLADVANGETAAVRDFVGALASA